MQRMSGADAGMLYQEGPRQHLHTIKIAVLEPERPLTVDQILATIAERAPRVPPLRWRAKAAPGHLFHPVWLRSDIDIDAHTHLVTAPAPGGREEFAALVSQFASVPLARDRPLWELSVIDGLVGGRVALVFKIHHALADGGSSARLLTALTDGGSGAEPSPVPPAEADPPFGRALAAAAADLGPALTSLPRLLRGAVGAARITRSRKQAGERLPADPFSGPATIYNEPLTPNRAYAYADVSLDRLRSVRRRYGCTLNELMLALVSASVRAHLADHDALPEQSLTASVPTTVRAADELDDYGNRIANMFMSLSTDVADPVARLEAIMVESEAAKAKLATRDGRLEHEWMELWPLWSVLASVVPRVGRRLGGRPSWNLVASNVRGSAEPLFFAGAPVVAIQSMGPVIYDLGLNFTGWSYLDRMNIGVVACPEHVDGLWELADGLHDALDALDHV